MIVSEDCESAPGFNRYNVIDKIVSDALLPRLQCVTNSNKRVTTLVTAR